MREETQSGRQNEEVKPNKMQIYSMRYGASQASEGGGDVGDVRVSQQDDIETQRILSRQHKSHPTAPSEESWGWWEVIRSLSLSWPGCCGVVRGERREGRGEGRG